MEKIHLKLQRFICVGHHYRTECFIRSSIIVLYIKQWIVPDTYLYGDLYTGFSIISINKK